MPNDITIDNILQIEAHAQALLDECRRLRAKLQGQQDQKKGRGLDPIQKAQLRAHREKVILRARLKMQATQKS